MKKRKFLISTLCAIFLLMLLPVLSVTASDNTLHSIDMHIVIREDGSALIAETWDITTTTGTEIYKEIKNMNGSSISSLIVTNGQIQFETLDFWDVNASREEKAQKSGIIVNSTGYELCFGIGEYGRNQYTMYYVIEGFVAKYYDKYGMNWQLINSDMSIKPEHISISITGHGIDVNSLMYAYGFEGSINLDKQEEIYYIIATNQMEDGRVGNVNYVNILVGFFDVSFSNSNTTYSSRTFEDIVEEANEGSDYHDNISEYYMFISSGSSVIRYFGIFLMIVVTFVLLLVFRGLRSFNHTGKLVRRGRYLNYTDGSFDVIRDSDIDYFRDIPCNKDLYFFYYLCLKVRISSESEARSGLITGLLLNWIRNGHVEFVKEEKRGVFSSKDSFKIHFKDYFNFDNDLDTSLYESFKEAAGRNEILENKEFEKWCARNYHKIDNWFLDVERTVKNQLKEEEYIEITKVMQKFLFFFDMPSEKVLYTPKFREEVKKVAGFKNFLLEFSSLGEKQAKEVFLWEEYLIFASALGIADKVEKEIGRLYPEFVDQSNLDVTYTTIATRSFVYTGIRRAVSAREAADSASNGGGGSSSYSGGGGSYSGGGGGGVR